MPYFYSLFNLSFGLAVRFFLFLLYTSYFELYSLPILHSFPQWWSHDYITMGQVYK